MDKHTQVNIFNDLYGGIVLNVSKTEGGLILTIDMSEYNRDPLSLLKCQLINCTEFELRTSRSKKIKNVNEPDVQNIELLDAQVEHGRIVVNCRINNNGANLNIITESIKVYDKEEKEVPLLQLSISAGLCSSDVGIDFVIGKTNKEAQCTEKYVKFDEEIHSYLIQKEKPLQKGNKHEFALLLGLDPYGDREFVQQEIHHLINICDSLIAKYNTEELNHQKVRYFSNKLKELCKEALQNNKGLFAIGD